MMIIYVVLGNKVCMEGSVKINVENNKAFNQPSKQQLCTTCTFLLVAVEVALNDSDCEPHDHSLPLCI